MVRRVFSPSFPHTWGKWGPPKSRIPSAPAGLVESELYMETTPFPPAPPVAPPLPSPEQQPPVPSPEQLQHAAEQLTRAVHVIFGEWTALRLAVENEWAGGGTRERALALLQRVRDGLLASAVVHRDELEDVIDNALVDDFNIEADDESPLEIATLLCALHTEARAGVTKTADVLLARSAGKRTWVEVPPPPRQRGEDDSSDEDIDDDNDGGGGGGTSAMDEDMGGGCVRAAPEVDEDGFQMVSPRRGRGAKVVSGRQPAPQSMTE